MCGGSRGYEYLQCMIPHVARPRMFFVYMYGVYTGEQLCEPMVSLAEYVVLWIEIYFWQ